MHDLTGVYALDALDADEADAFETHLESCSDCRREVQELQEVAAALALVEMTVPPPAIRERILEAVADGRPAGPVPPLAALASAAVVAPIDVTPTRRRRAPWYAAMAAAAALLLLLAGFGAARLRSPATGDASQTVAQEVAAATAVVRDPAARLIALDGPSGASGQVRWSEREARGVLTVRDLPAPGPGQVYELWYIDGSPRPGPLFDADTSTVVIAGQGVHPPATFAVTIEPAGGVDKATGPVVLSGGARR